MLMTQGDSSFCFRERECETVDKEYLERLALRPMTTPTITEPNKRLIESESDLREAISQLNAGNIGLCGHYLTRAIPGLWPLRKILGA